MIGMDGERESGKSILEAWLDVIDIDMELYSLEKLTFFVFFLTYTEYRW